MTCRGTVGMNRNNYRVFRDLESHGVHPARAGSMFGTFLRPQRDSPGDARLGGASGAPRCRAASSISSAWACWGRMYSRRKAHELGAGWREDRHTGGLRPDLASEHDSRVASLNRRIVEQAQSISEQLSSMQSGDAPGFDLTSNCASCRASLPARQLARADGPELSRDRPRVQGWQLMPT